MHIRNEDMSYGAEIQALFTSIYGILALVGITGNIMTISVVLCVSNMLTPTNCYLLSLATSDLLFFMSGIPVEMSYLYVKDNNYSFGQFGCRCLTYLAYMAINTSSLSIMALTLERYIGICHPLRARNVCTVHRAKSIIRIIWIVSLLYNLPWMFVVKLDEQKKGNTTISHCNFAIDRQSNMYKMIYGGDFLLFYLLPMVLYFVLYGRIVHKLSFQAKDPVERSLDTRPTISTSRKSYGDIEQEISVTLSPRFSISGIRRTLSVTPQSAKPVRVRRKAKAVKLLAVVATVFGVCWLPYRAMVMYNSFATNTWNPEGYIFFAKSMLFVNCAINPILYNFISTKFRRSFRMLLQMTKICCVNQEGTWEEEIRLRNFI